MMVKKTKELEMIVVEGGFKKSYILKESRLQVEIIC